MGQPPKTAAQSPDCWIQTRTRQWRALRCVCIYYTATETFSLIPTAIELSYDDCYLTNSRTTISCTVFIHILNIVIYSWGTKVARERNAASGQKLLYSSFVAQLLSVLVRFCRASEYDQSPRELSAQLEETCYYQCISSPPPARGYGYGRQDNESICSGISRVSGAYVAHINMVANMCIFVSLAPSPLPVPRPFLVPRGCGPCRLLNPAPRGSIFRGRRS